MFDDFNNNSCLLLVFSNSHLSLKYKGKRENVEKCKEVNFAYNPGRLRMEFDSVPSLQDF